LEYIHNPNDSRLITDLDSEDNIEININIENLDESDDLKITTIVTEVNESDVTDKTTNTTKTVRRSISPQKQPQSPKDTLDRKMKVERTKVVDQTDVSRSQQGMYKMKFCSLQLIIIVFCFGNFSQSEERIKSRFNQENFD
jgi:hypothetical protein